MKKKKKRKRILTYRDIPDQLDFLSFSAPIQSTFKIQDTVSTLPMPGLTLTWTIFELTTGTVRDLCSSRIRWRCRVSWLPVRLCLWPVVLPSRWCHWGTRPQNDALFISKYSCWFSQASESYGIDSQTLLRTLSWSSYQAISSTIIPSFCYFFGQTSKSHFCQSKESLGERTGEPRISYFKKELKQHFYDLATLVDNSTQLPRH